MRAVSRLLPEMTEIPHGLELVAHPTSRQNHALVLSRCCWIQLVGPVLSLGHSTMDRGNQD